MSDREIISTFKYVSRMKPEFMLSELTDYLKEKTSVKQVYKTLKPLFFDLGVDVVADEGDFRIVRAAPLKKIELTADEIKKNERFFKSTAVSRKMERLVEQYIEKKTSKNWDDEIVMEKIRKAIRDQKADYWKEGSSRKISYETGYSTLGYLAYQFPVYFVQFQYLLHDLAKEGMLKNRMKILDVGTGPGTIPLAIIDFYNRLDDRKANIHTIELFDENIEAYNFLVPQYAGIKSNVTIEEPIRADVSKLNVEKLPDNIDLMVFSNVLNEMKDLSMEQKADIVKNMAGKLSPDGSIIIIEPADKVNSTGMRTLTIMLKRMGIKIYSPCSFIWSGECTLETCWSFEHKRDIEPTRLMLKLAECNEPYRYINTDIKYSYAILRKDKLSRQNLIIPDKAKFARMSKIDMHNQKHINVIGSLMSEDLGDERYKLYRICDGTSKKAVYAVLPTHNLSEDNEVITKAQYGSIIKLFNVLVKYNETNDSYNLLIGKGTTVEPQYHDMDQ
ncbi:small ribosomal subunit Rsm22 family protein [Methanolobus mangrovi]|uniref:Small ribosomal subunit Rsm22 family protein n=1 Tax=Methanolobus mangrovi TaxID=3072977 RepID=A0AA51UJL6_9EURY|nr:small ribosomal subunit Rsm22 family protein [Methanolobus mangrovi]WMW22901.1 small ribosomal subunit Rsm22 family protein [Methanolobus mangrovi]